MHDDDPDDVVHNLFAAQAWGDSPLGRPIAGTEESIAALTRDQIVALLPRALPAGHHGGGRRRQRRPRGAGAPGGRGVRPQRLPRHATRPPVPPRVGGRPRAGHARHGRGHPALRAGQRGARHGGPHPATTTAASRSACSTPRSAAARRAGSSRRSASTAGWPTRCSRSPATTPTPAWSASRSAACRSKLDDVLAVVRDELAKVAADGITAEELARGKGQLRGGTGARPRGLRLADVAARQGRAGLRRAARASTR